MTKVYICIVGVRTIFTYNHDSLERNEVSVNEILQALDDPARIDSDEGLSHLGNPRVMWVGLTFSDRLIEIGIEYQNGNIDHVYHADNAQAKYKTIYYKRNK